MDKSTRIRLIREVRACLLDLDWDEQQLVLSEFQFPLPEGNRTLLWALAQGEDDALLAIASHFTVEASATSDMRSAPRPSPGKLIVFASHLSSQGRLVGAVEASLALLGVQLFVAHISIEPDKEWRDEILKTLDTCHAAIMFVHRGFKDSQWCPQEAGWLLGRRIPVFSLKFDETPTGPLGERQAIDASKMSPEAMASSIMDLMIGRSELHNHLATSFSVAMDQALHFSTTDLIWDRLRSLRNLDEDQCRTLMKALQSNSQVYRARSPYDDGRPYKQVISDFLQLQPGVDAVRATLDSYIANLSLDEQRS